MTHNEYTIKLLPGLRYPYNGILVRFEAREDIPVPNPLYLAAHRAFTLIFHDICVEEQVDSQLADDAIDEEGGTLAPDGSSDIGSYLEAKVYRV